MCRRPRRWSLAVLGLVAGLGVMGFGNDASSFSKRDLPKLIFAKSEAPPGTRFNPRNVGVGFLEREGGNGPFFALLRPHGFVADAGSEFSGSAQGIAARPEP